MARKKGKTVSFDAMVKFFMQYYNIPTKKDVEKLVERMDRLEKVIKESDLYGKGRRISTSKSSKETTSASRSGVAGSTGRLERCGSVSRGRC